LLCSLAFSETELERLSRTAYQMIIVGDYEKAENLLRSGLNSYPENDGLMWRLAMALNRKADCLTGMDRHNALDEANQLLIKSIRLNNKNPQAHVEMARSLGYSGLFKNEWDSYSLAGRVKEELDIAQKQDSLYADTYYILGLWNRYVSERPLLLLMPQGLGSASAENAVNSFLKAIKLNPDNALYHLELARQYLLIERKEEAQKSLQKAISSKNNLFNKKFIDEAKKLQETLHGNE
jgi:tetratricopeptide (TPR) repeat protein